MPRRRKLPPRHDILEGSRSEAERRAASDMELRREIADDIDLWAECDREPCRRARACRVADVPCFDEQREIVRELVAERAREWCRLAGVEVAFEPDDALDENETA